MILLFHNENFATAYSVSLKNQKGFASKLLKGALKKKSSMNFNSSKEQKKYKFVAFKEG